MGEENYLNPWANYQAFMQKQVHSPEDEQRKMLVAEIKKLRKAKMIKDMMKAQGMDPDALKQARIREVNY